MIAVIQRVSHASVTIDGLLFSEIGKGLLILVGVRKGIPKRMPCILPPNAPACAFLKTKRVR